MAPANVTSNPASSWVDVLLKHMPTATVVIYSLIIVVGTLGNGLVIYVTSCRLKRSVNSVWFFNLALADFIFTSVLVFLTVAVSQQHQWPFGNFMCKFVSLVSTISMFTSIFLLVAVSVDRCLAVWVVVWAQNRRTVGKARLATVVIWVAAAVCSAPFSSFRTARSYPMGTYCTYAEGTPKRTLVIFRFIMGFFIPFQVICISYVAICVRARRMQRTRRHISHRIILSIIFAFFFCWLPFHVIQFIELKLKTDPHLKHVVQIGSGPAMILAFTNSCLNPILYVFMCNEFRKKLKKSVCHVLESALAEDFLNSRSLSTHFSVNSRKSESGTGAPERRGTDTGTDVPECKQPTGGEETKAEGHRPILQAT